MNRLFYGLAAATLFACGGPDAERLDVPEVDTTSEGLLVNVNASCGCEHFGTQYDQFCEATPQFAPPNAFYEYIYTWIPTEPGVILSPPGGSSPSTVASCIHGSGCEVKLKVKVEAVDSFYWPIQKRVYGFDFATCNSGTPNPGF